MTYRTDGFYLLAGGLGGLGRSLVARMIKNGARHFIFLQRTGAVGRERETFLLHLQQAGIVAKVIKGDVTIREDVDRAVAAADRLPILGVLQAVMNLEVCSATKAP
jgi:NAD(P)-dependent dehydrogenase (short-subunit alcohol dehydrogenase family)